MFQNYFTRVHMYVFVGLLIGATVLTFLVANAGVDEGPHHARQVFWTTCATLLGPMTGAVSRDFQSCCLAASLSLALYVGVFLAVAAVVQVIRLPFEAGARTLRLAIWFLGWSAWFLSGLLSMGHAFS